MFHSLLGPAGCCRCRRCLPRSVDERKTKRPIFQRRCDLRTPLASR
ncbi:hypothetical protein KCP73_22005 [Salmonella enterica subsp. enterica]|nr:hypothetical protein KCP73_22005 [Salmonella enterica subsp. enterica]